MHKSLLPYQNWRSLSVCIPVYIMWGCKFAYGFHCLPKKNWKKKFGHFLFTGKDFWRGIRIFNFKQIFFFYVVSNSWVCKINSYLAAWQSIMCVEILPFFISIVCFVICEVLNTICRFMENKKNSVFTGRYILYKGINYFRFSHFKIIYFIRDLGFCEEFLLAWKIVTVFQRELSGIFFFEIKIV